MADLSEMKAWLELSVATLVALGIIWILVKLAIDIRLLYTVFQ